ncbi:hypothetical protein C5167_019244 [Papaver somniferum]|uniref:AP-5 complex subunit zeta-1 n=1 Tax=Papaver somniferum TaxID=3469 RepID=A0A4Y7ITQ1_PAPSO|nr:hypothetical protein C5167_019244 [Papaver somniferum]
MQKQSENRDKDWDYHLRSLSQNARDSTLANDPASDPSVLPTVKKLHEICKAEVSEDLIARVYTQTNKLFQRAVAASLSQTRTSNGLLLLAILQFFLDFRESVLHDADASLRTFFRSCLSRKLFVIKMLKHQTLRGCPKLAVVVLADSGGLVVMYRWYSIVLPFTVKADCLEWTKIFPGVMSPGSFLPLFPSLVDLPILVVALEKVERSSGSLIGSSIASIQKSTAPEMLLALMDEAYTGSTIEDRGGDSGTENGNNIDVADSIFLDLLKDENDGLVERQWTSPGTAAALQVATNTPQSDRLRQALQLTPRILDIYFRIALRDVNKSLTCALVPLLMTRNSTIFPDKVFAYEVRRRLLKFMLAAFQRSPEFIALLKKPIVDRLGEAYENPAKMELALQLCWAIGEHGGGGRSHKDAARELFESLELLLYENLSSSRLGLNQDFTLGSTNSTFRKSSQARLLCFVVTAIAKLATNHRELLPRAHVSLGKVARSRNADMRVWRRANDYLGLMKEPAICKSILGPPSGQERSPGTVNWSEGGSKMIAHIPFYILSEQESPPFHDFSFSDILPSKESEPIS